ncbi:MAG: hypothetical protein HRT44_04125 [Bdellovibrionales bacterium]|nr:hypothetical protein [Bdellovibrionales bacterium]NQZ18430.1 hypothetical protein [Bdellovibrionales bacterium]
MAIQRRLVGALLILLGLSLTVQANEQEFLEVNEEYSEIYREFLQFDHSKEEDLVTLRVQADTASADKEAKEAVYTPLKEKVDQLNLNMTEKNGQLGTALTVLGEAEAAIEAIRLDAVVDKALFEETELVTQENISAKISALASEIERLGQEISGFETQISDIKKTAPYAPWAKEQREIEIELNQTRQHKARREAVIQGLDDQIGALDFSIKSADLELVDMGIRKDQLEKTILPGLQTQISELNVRILELRGEITAADSVIFEDQDEVNDIQKVISDLSSEIFDKEGLQDDYEEEIGDIRLLISGVSERETRISRITDTLIP